MGADRAAPRLILASASPRRLACAKAGAVAERHPGAFVLGADTVVAVGALRRLSADHGELKSMHTAQAARGRGVGSAMLRHIMAAARARGMSRLSLETGSWAYFAPARALYARHGFVECGPFGEYREDPNSVFMTLELGGGEEAAGRADPAAERTIA